MQQPGKPEYHILVVDDEPTVRLSIKMILTHWGHKVQAVHSGEAALAIIEQNLFDLVITDYSMEGMNGNELTAAIKRYWPGQPVIMATAFAADFHPAGKSTGGADCVLSKPFRIAELQEAIDWVMSNRITAPPATPDESVSSADAPVVPPPQMLPPPQRPRSTGP